METHHGSNISGRTRSGSRLKRKPFSDLTNTPSSPSFLRPKPAPALKSRPRPAPDPAADPQPAFSSTSGDQENGGDLTCSASTPKSKETAAGPGKDVGNNDKLDISAVSPQLVKASEMGKEKVIEAAPALSCPPLGRIRSAGGNMRLKDYVGDLHKAFSVPRDKTKKGCDGSILLDDTSSFTGEKTAGPNNNSVRGFEVIDTIKSQVETICKQVVSCADIVAVAARDSVVALGGPSWTVQLGRRDARTASFSAANSDIPSPTSDLSTLISAFSKKGLSATDMVALSGAHTIGQARCTTFRTRIYNETDIDSSLATSLQSNCPSSGSSGDNNLSPLDAVSPNFFDNFYFKNLFNKKGLLHSDQQLYNGGSADSQTSTYSTNIVKFYSDFTGSMVKMGSISPLTGSSGEVRTNCRKTN